MPRKASRPRSTKPKAPEPMPSLVFSSGDMNDEPTPEKTIPLSPREKIASLSAYNRFTKRWLWTGVIGVSLIIFCLWGYAMFTQLSFFRWSDSSEARLIAQTRQEWNAIFDNEEPLGQNVKQQISHVMEQLVASSTVETAATTTATTTPLQQPLKK